MESSKRTMVVLLAREKRAITNVFDFNPTVEKQHLAL
jgi:hypothetical protein